MAVGRAFYQDGKPFSGKDVMRVVKENNPTNTVLLSFSRGKDSVCCLSTLLDYGFKVVPYYLYFVPGISFVDESLEWYESFFGLKIYRLPSPGMFRMLRNFIYQTPERVAVIRAMNLPDVSHDQLSDLVKKDQNLPNDTFVSVGVRAFDNLKRRTNIAVQGPVNWNRKTFYPIWDMSVQQVEDLITQKGILLPSDYRMFGRSFDGLMYRFIKPIKDNYPDDYAKILEWYPLVDAELKRYEMR